MTKRQTLYEKNMKTYDDNIDIFINEMRKAGVTDKTIKQVIKEINDYQMKQINKMMKETLERARQIILESNGDE